MVLSETMAKRKKSKTPAPPTQSSGGRKKPVPGTTSKATSGGSAKQGGSSPLSNLDPRQLRFLLIGGVGLVVIVAIVIAVSVGGSDASANPMPVTELTAAGCTPFAGVAPTAWDHVPDGQEGDYEFGTFPRTADIHDPELLIWNRYTEPVSQMRLGHNLEHGGIYVQYGDGVSAETVQTIAEWWDSDPNGIIVAPFPELDADVIALGSWWTPNQSDASEHGDGADAVYLASLGQLTYCNEFDEAAFSAFRDAFRGRGPEAFPVNALQPGT